MKIKRHASVVGIIAAGALALTACGSDDNSPSGTSSGSTGPTATASVNCGGKTKLTAEGSTAQGNAMQAFQKAYEGQCSGFDIAYNPTGSGAGVKGFTTGTDDFAGSDSALDATKGEVDAAAKRCNSNPAWNLPLVFGPVGIAYNVPNVTNLVLDGPTAAKIFDGEIKTWDDAAIKALNSGATLPSTPITVIFRSDQSGTTDNFQKYLTAASKSGWTKGAGKTFNGGVGQGAQGTAGVAQAVKAGEGAIGYLEWSAIEQNKLSTAKLDAGNGPVELTADTAAKGIASAKVSGTGNDLRLDLTALYSAPPSGAYPLVLATYEIVCSKGYSPDVAQAVKAFLTTAATTGQQGLTDIGYVPLPNDFQQKLLTAISAIQ